MVELEEIKRYGILNLTILEKESIPCRNFVEVCVTFFYSKC